MAWEDDSPKGRRRATSFKTLKSVLNSITITKSPQTKLYDDPVTYPSQALALANTTTSVSNADDRTAAWVNNAVRSNSSRPNRSSSCPPRHAALLLSQSPTRLSSLPSPSLALLEYPKFNGQTPFPSPFGSEASISTTASALVPTKFQRAHDLRHQELFSAADSHESSLDQSTPTYLRAGSGQQLQQYRQEVTVHHLKVAPPNRVQFNSPLATFFTISAENSTEGSQTPLSMEHAAQQTGSISPIVQDNMSSSSGYTVVPQILLPKTFEGFPPKTKLTIRAKTPSFSSDSEDGRPEVYHGRSVSMNSDKGWEPDVKRSRSKENYSQGESQPVDSTDGFKPVFGPIALPSLSARTLQVPDFNSHSRTASGNTTGSGASGATGTTGFLDQDELMGRMLGPEQQVKNAENHVAAMQEALKKAFSDRKEAEKRTAVAEALLKSSLALRTNERGEKALMELLRKAEENLSVSETLLEKSRQRAVSSEERALNAEILVQRMGDNAEGSVKTLLHAEKQETRRYEYLYKEEKERVKSVKRCAESAEQRAASAEQRVESAEQRAERAEAMQEEDRKWTVDAAERTVFAEDKATEVSKQLHAARELIDELQVQLTLASSQAEKFKKEAEDAVTELTATIQGHMDEADISLRIKNRLKRVFQQYNELKEEHAAREAEFNTCQITWDRKEIEYAAMDAKWQAWGDETAAVRAKDLEQQELDVEELIYDRNLIIKTFAERIEQMRVEQRFVDLEEFHNLVQWAKKEPKMKKGKEVAGTSQSIVIGREKTRRQLEGLAFTPSLDSVEEPKAFESPTMGEHQAAESNIKANLGHADLDAAKKLSLEIPVQQALKDVTVETPLGQTIKNFTYQAAVGTDPVKKGPFDFDGPARSALKEPSPIEPATIEGLGFGAGTPPKTRLATIFEVLEAAKSRKGSSSSTSVSDAPPPTPPKDDRIRKPAVPLTTPSQPSGEDGVVKLPSFGRGAWYSAMLASPKK